MKGILRKRRSNHVYWLILLGAIAVLFAAVAANLYVSHGRLTKREDARLRTQARVVKENVLKSLTAISTVLDAIRAEKPVSARKSDLNYHLELFTEAMPGVRTMMVLDAQGKVVASSRPELLGQDFSGREYFRVARDTPDPERLFVLPPFKTMLGMVGMFAEKVIVAPDGSFAGLVQATLDPQYFETLLESILYAPDMWAAVAHGDGLQFMMVPDKPGQEGKDLAQPGAFFSRHRDSGNELDVMIDVVNDTGERRMLAIQSIIAPALRQDKPLVVVVGRDLDTVYMPWHRDLVAQFSLVGLIALLSVLALWFHLRRQAQFVRRELEATHFVETMQRFLLAMSDHVPGVVAYWDKELHCRYASRRYAEWFGQEKDTMIGAELANVLGPRLFEMNQQYIAGVMRGESQVFERSLTNMARAPRHIIVQYIPDKVGEQVEGFFVLLTDVSVQRQTLEERLAGVVAQRDTLVREVHHRIKNALQAVTGLLQRQLGQYPELQPPLEHAIAQVMAVATVHGLQGKSDSDLLRLDSMLAEIVGNARERLDENYSLCSEMPSGFSWCVDKAEAVPLALILNELVQNAIKHGRAASDACVSIDLRVQSSADMVTVIVSNEAEEDLPVGFDFASGVGVGAGLGLVKALMPVRGAFLYFFSGDGRISAVLCLESPVIYLNPTDHVSH
jgi:two-component sensor histidine kinase/PAS domain-containing protein